MSPCSLFPGGGVLQVFEAGEDGRELRFEFGVFLFRRVVVLLERVHLFLLCLDGLARTGATLA